MRRDNKGMVLLTSVILLSIITLLLLSLLQFSVMTMQSHHQWVEKNNQFYQLDKKLTQLVKSDIFRLHSPCTLPQSAARDIAKRCVKKTACSVSEEKASYRYWVEDLGVFPCLQVGVGNQNLLGSHHWLLRVARENSITKTITARIAMPEKTDACQNEAVLIPTGILSWQYDDYKF